MYFSQQQQKNQHNTKNTATQKHNNSLTEITKKLKLREIRKRLNIHKETKVNQFEIRLVPFVIFYVF